LEAYRQQEEPHKVAHHIDGSFSERRMSAPFTVLRSSKIDNLHRLRDTSPVRAHGTRRSLTNDARIFV
jgi:hypothetical protein